MDDIEKDLTTLQYRNMVNYCRCINTLPMDKEIKNRERITKQIAKTSNLICKKYRALKTSKMEEDIALERHFKPIVKSLKQIIENTVGEKFDMESDENETFFLGEEEPKLKQKRSNALWQFSNSNFYSL